MANKQAKEREPSKPKTPTFLLELPLLVEAGQAARVGAHLEVGRQFYNALLSAGQPAPSRRSGKPPSRPCGSATASPSTPFTSWRKGYASAG